MKPIKNKEQMFTLLQGGALGNTIPQFNLEQWLASEDRLVYPTWGIRTKTAGGGPSRHNVPTADVPKVVEEFKPHAVNISVMLISVGRVTWYGDIWRTERGLYCAGQEMPPLVHYPREIMKRPTEWRGLSALHLLQRRLNPDSYADLEALLDQRPDHVVELSTLDRCFGTVPGRNAVIWEQRLY